MAFMLLVGFIFWSTIAFVGTRKTFDHGGNAFCDKLRQIKAVQPQSLFLVGVVAPTAGALLVLIEIRRILHLAGTIGAIASLGFMLGIAGGIAMAAHLSIQPKRIRIRTDHPEQS